MHFFFFFPFFGRGVLFYFEPGGKGAKLTGTLLLEWARHYSKEVKFF